MAYEIKNNTGTLRKNDRKEKDTHPDYKGSSVINDREYWVSAWLKTDKNGAKYMSFSYTAKDAQALVGSQMVRAGEPNSSQSISERAMPKGRDSFGSGSMRHNDMNDDIPFAPEFR